MNIQLIAGYLQLLRKNKGLTQEDLANELGVSRQAVSKWETGSGLPDMEILLQLSDIYGITINDMLRPKIKQGRITDFEEIDQLPQDYVRKATVSVEQEVLVKASMGASPRVNEWLSDCFTQIDFEEERRRIGRIRITEVEEAQNEILSLINLLITI